MPNCENCRPTHHSGHRGLNGAVTGWEGNFAQNEPLDEQAMLADPLNGAAVAADLDMRFGVVKARLVELADRGAPALVVRQGERRMARPALHAGVQECLAALEVLQATLVSELIRNQELEMQAVDALAALSQVRVALTDAQAGERRAQFLASHDSLTSLPNRSFFREQLASLLAQPGTSANPLAVLYFDLDGFKQINDAYGHEVGDETLRMVAARLARAVRAKDMVGRLGGDEFACLIDGASSRDDISRLAAKLFYAVAAPFKVGQLTLNVQSSMGIAQYPRDGDSVEYLLRCADAAMYRAKRDQIRYAFFDDGLDGDAGPSTR